MKTWTWWTYHTKACPWFTNDLRDVEIVKVVCLPLLLQLFTTALVMLTCSRGILALDTCFWCGSVCVSSLIFLHQRRLTTMRKPQTLWSVRSRASWPIKYSRTRLKKVRLAFRSGFWRWSVSFLIKFFLPFYCLRLVHCYLQWYSRIYLEKPPHWPQKCGLSTQVVSGDRCSCTEM